MDEIPTVRFTHSELHPDHHPEVAEDERGNIKEPGGTPQSIGLLMTDCVKRGDLINLTSLA